MYYRNLAAFILTFFSLFFLVPGVSLSMLRIDSGEAVSTKFINVKTDLYNKSRSILNTVEYLYHHNNRFVAIVIFICSVIIPVVKGLGLGFIFFSRNYHVKKKIFNFIKAIAKWSMNDVFIVAIFLAYLSAGTTIHELSTTALMGKPLEIDVLFNMTAHLEMGFWCFLTYCLMSLLALQLYSIKPDHDFSHL